MRALLFAPMQITLLVVTCCSCQRKDALMLDVDGFVCETNATNVFCVREFAHFHSQ